MRIRHLADFLTPKGRGRISPVINEVKKKRFIGQIPRECNSVREYGVRIQRDLADRTKSMKFGTEVH